MSRVDDIRARADKATRGPWKNANKSVRVQGTQCCNRAPTGYKGGICNCLGGGALDGVNSPVNKQALANAIFIAHARDDVPWLLSEVARLTTIVETGNPVSKAATADGQRLVDANALEQVLEADDALMARRAETEDRGFLAVGAGLTLALAALDAAPTVEAEPVVHAYWEPQTWHDENADKERRAGYQCSKCGQHSAVKHIRCMTCAARMDAQRKDGGETDAG